MITTMSAHYFSPATFTFLGQLRQNNNREWFHAHKVRYEQYVREPFLALLADLQTPLATISTHFHADTRKVGGSMFRMHRDLRYSKNKMPYKPFAGARLFHERRREIAAPSFYIHIEPDGCFLGAGLWRPEPHTMRNIRNFIVDNPATWKRITRDPAFEQCFTFRGECLKRHPRGFDPDHELIEDLKRKNVAAITDISETFACGSDLFDFTVATFKQLAPLVDYLCAAQDLSF